MYQSTRQLRAMELLSLENPPMEAPVRFQGAPADNGMIPEADLFSLLDGAIGAYDALLEQYAEEADKAA